jgi:F-type H+-transporting ATPase subunit b
VAVIEDPVFWVAVAFLIFIGLLFWLNVPAKLAEGLDQRSAKIENELDDARHLKEEAKALLAQIQRKHHEAKAEADAMVEQSMEEAKLFAKDAEKELKAYFDRQERTAGEKIGQAEADAVKEVQMAAVDVAVRAARQILREELGSEAKHQLAEKAIGELQENLTQQT